MIYKCDSCDFNTENKSKYNRHLTTYKHKYIINDIKNEIVCQNCGKKFSCNANKHRHIRLEKCDKLDCLKEEFKNNMVAINNKIDTFTNIVNENTNIINENTSTVKYAMGKSMDTLKYVMKTFTKSPSIPTLKGKLLDDLLAREDKRFDNVKEKTFEEKVICSYTSNTLDGYLGDKVIKMFKKVNPHDQSLWSADCARTKFVIKIDGKWEADTKGEKVKELIIHPVLDETIERLEIFEDVLLNRINKYNLYKKSKLFHRSNDLSDSDESDGSKEYKKMTNDDELRYIKYRDIINLVISDSKIGKPFANDILSYIKGHFSLKNISEEHIKQVQKSIKNNLLDDDSDDEHFFDDKMDSVTHDEFVQMKDRIKELEQELQKYRQSDSGKKESSLQKKTYNRGKKTNYILSSDSSSSDDSNTSDKKSVHSSSDSSDDPDKKTKNKNINKKKPNNISSSDSESYDKSHIKNKYSKNKR